MNVFAINTPNGSLFLDTETGVLAVAGDPLRLPAEDSIWLHPDAAIRLSFALTRYAHNAMNTKETK